jgi:hypothetical protein
MGICTSSLLIKVDKDPLRGKDSRKNKELIKAKITLR